ncbi:DUF1330 domain-containing protein [bacterium]|nr:DUF1330 domain-containing protein [bacterium]
MPVYFIAEITVKDPETYKKYVSAVPDLVRAAGGRYLSRGGAIESVFGGWSPERLILIEFTSRAQAHAFLDSPEYSHVKQFREVSTESRAIIIEGCAPEPGAAC